MLVYYIVDLAYQLHFLFCILQVTTNLQSSVIKPRHFFEFTYILYPEFGLGPLDVRGGVATMGQARNTLSSSFH